MALKPMYGVVNNSPLTKLSEWITATATTIVVEDMSRLPSAPNVATIGVEENAELFLYNGIEGNALTGCIRGFSGTLAQVWPADEPVYRAYSSYDHTAFLDNIVDINERATAMDADKLDVDGDGSNVTAEFVQAGTRTNIASGLTLATLFGRVMRWFADLRDGAFAAFGTGANEVARGDHTHEYNTLTGKPTIPSAAADVGAAPTSHASADTAHGAASEALYGHAMASSATPLVAGTASTGTDNGKYAREGHVHPAQTSVSGNAGTATKLETARSIAGHAFDGTENVEIDAADVGAEPSRLQFSSITILATVWADDSTYDGYSVRAAIPLAGVTATMVPSVIFAPSEAGSGNFAPVASSYAGGIYVYAKGAPEEGIVIPTILVWR